ncbi:PPE family protein [Mycobacterium sp. HUMS_1102779]|uniref:PPE family protein n=1 Tax=Mycobacterium sp. HUMS_1102779 TaxID=3383487 RepID=UPI00389A8312
MDFGILPPEVNSGLLCTGPGSAPMLAAAAAWDGVATDLEIMAAAYSSTTSGLASRWHGPSFAAMAAAAQSYTTWLDTSAVRARQTAVQARAAVAAYEAAFAATVPPPAVAANRSLLASLVATNIFGQNTPAIAATELDYAEMWEQDAAAMYGYASSASAASAVTPFVEPPQATNSSGLVAQAAAVTRAAQTPAQTLPALLSSVPQLLHTMAAPVGASPAAATPSSLVDVLANVTVGSLSPFNLLSGLPEGELVSLLLYSVTQTGVNFANVASKFDKVVLGLPPGVFGSGGVLASSAAPAQVSASMGRAALISNMSVPHGWVLAAPEIKPAAVFVPVSEPAAAVAAVTAVEEGNLFGGMALSGLAGRAIVGTGAGTATAGNVRTADAAAADDATINIILITEDDE